MMHVWKSIFLRSSAIRVETLSFEGFTFLTFLGAVGDVSIVTVSSVEGGGGYIYRRVVERWMRWVYL